MINSIQTSPYSTHTKNGVDKTMSEPNIQLLPCGLVVHNHTLSVLGIKKKILYHFSDTHLALSDALSTPQEAQKAKDSTEGWEKGREGFARQYDQLCTEAQKRSPRTHFENLLRHAAADGDAIVLCGDIFDYVSGANLRFFDGALADISTPVMAVCGNHEDLSQIPDGCRFVSAKEPVQLLDLGDLTIIGFDNSLREITPAQNKRLLEVLEEGKPIIVAMHIPIMTAGNSDILTQCGEYFRLNHPEADASTLEFIEILKRHASKIIAVLAGHLHFSNESEIAPGLTQYVSTQGVLGNISRYEIGG